jgi:ubiquinone/menaquinone biosynthesis C-methylase UbiE
VKEQERIRQGVQQDYTKAVQRPGAGCCSGSCEPKGVAAKVAGYSSAELGGLPTEAVENSFGCGNPLAFSEVKTGQTVLDLGSGAGLDLLIAAQKVGPTGHVIGVDMTDAMISKGRENVAKAGVTQVEIRKGIIEELPVETGSVDWVISNCVINLSPEKPKVFAEIARVLKREGKMSVSDIVAEDLPEELIHNRKVHSACLAGAIPEKDYVEGLRKAGLVDVEIRDRLIYDAKQMEDFLVSEGVDDRIEKWASQLVGKVASVRIVARKP